MLVRVRRILRIDELLKVKLKPIKLQESRLKISIPKSKTDQHRDGHVVYISRIKSECCPVKYSEPYLQKAKFDIRQRQRKSEKLHKETPLICCTLKIKSGHKISQRGF